MLRAAFFMLAASAIGNVTPAQVVLGTLAAASSPEPMASIPGTVRDSILSPYMPKPLPSNARLSQHRQLLAEFEGFARSGGTAEGLMQHISDRLHEELVRYNWVGFFLIDKKDPKILVLGPFSGTATPHTRILLSQGLCGAAATTGKTIVGNDVSTDPRYLMGSEHTKSEIVAPVFAQNSWAQSLMVQSPLILNRVAAELTINSYFKDTFDQEERQFVESCSALVGKYL